MRVVATADLHGNLPLDLPDGDVLVIAGDICPLADHEPSAQQSWLDSDFYPWMEHLPHPEVVWIAGNHDFVCQRPGWLPGGRGHYLCDSGVTLDGYGFWGFPWVPKLQMWAFYASDPELAERAAAIPATDVLVSHGPPLGRGDRLSSGKLAGSEALLARLRSRPPRLCLYGHIHEDPGSWELDGATLANVAYVDELYEIRPDPVRCFEL